MNEPWEPTEQITLPDGSSYTTERPPRAEETSEVVKRIRQDIRAAMETLRRILANEEPYRDG